MGMAGILWHRTCLPGTRVIWEQISQLAPAFLDQVNNGERSLSSASASTSTSRTKVPPAHLGRRRLASAITLYEGIASCGQQPSCRGNPDAFRHTFATAASQSFSSVAAATATKPDPANAGGSSTVASTSSRFLAPWPWVDPSRPQVLPVSVGKKQRQPVPLSEALTRLLDALPAGDRPRSNLEVFIRFRLDPRRSDHLVRGSVVLPYGTGKPIRLVVFAKGDDADIARSEGADLIGDEELISAIVSSEGAAINFDRLIATPDFMRPLARAGKVLGPKGLMPNPKMGTLTTDVAGAIRDIRRGRLDYRLSREATVRAVLGRGTMTAEQLQANVGALVASLIENKPKVVAGPPAAAAAAAAATAAAAAAGPGAMPAAAAAPTVAMLERYFMTFALKTSHSASVHISLDSLLEAAAGSRPAPASGGPQQQQAQAKAQAKDNATAQEKSQEERK